VSVFNLLNAVFGAQKPVNAISSVTENNGLPQQGEAGISPYANNNNKNNNVPKFGIKGKQPLKEDMFEYKGQKMGLSAAKQKSYDDVYRHEAAHLAAAGSYATSGINIDYDGRGIATSGHVNIAMPKLNKNNPKETIKHAETVIASAEAPAGFDELSSADKSVAAQARAVKAQALNYMA